MLPDGKKLEEGVSTGHLPVLQTKRPTYRPGLTTNIGLAPRRCAYRKGIVVETKSNNAFDPARRELLLQTVASAAGLMLAGCATTGSARGNHGRAGEAEHDEAEVTPGEDLMQEHGVLERVLLIYDEAARRIERSERFDLAVLTNAAGIVRRFVEDYHEKQEEQFVFPRLETAGREVELVAVLRLQHQRGRDVTDRVMRLANAGATPELAQVLRSFARMYRPHAAREDTVLFPAFRSVVGGAGYRELGEQFEDNEHKLFGEHGFDTVVNQVAELERALGIHDLAAFTPT
jgi:hemerythrin-like domain-containing protein